MVGQDPRASGELDDRDAAEGAPNQDMVRLDSRIEDHASSGATDDHLTGDRHHRAGRRAGDHLECEFHDAEWAMRRRGRNRPVIGLDDTARKRP